ncbi:BZ3500_MvSof-1268-A1-R1_Chr4-4g07493 [Microbotryum saponariae]|uniref:BZ3500_MvSof-1268-A1-R1_Chr4-4g07493 protein n=1 Tax=Microbotryum saponariae TaxID=289078 RepID=A0A2X0LJC5_9BASI|nr:BZ3500_MvSof-1268-A1-R1_Chr4-4g07493 [Microbotryum saponariae]SDA07154.1 BZ3501_MvSof-1269-A2-R1_Chr4-3g07201 [Microbotryum saponariae]
MGNNQSSGSSSQHSSPSGHFPRSRSTTASSVNGSAHSAAAHGHGAVSSNAQHGHASADVPLSDKTVDGGTLEPSSHLFASSVQDYSRPVVHRLILERRLAPFHLGLDDYEDEWTVEQIVEALDEAERQAARKLQDAHASAVEAVIEAEATMQTTPLGSTRKSKDSQVAVAHATIHRERLAELIKHRERRAAATSNRPDREVARQDLAKQYLGKAVECPICFLYYPPPMVHTRCCDQPICTECFVQIKRAEPTTTHLESEPAACPFCMEPNFGCVYTKEMVSLLSYRIVLRATRFGASERPVLTRKRFFRIRQAPARPTVAQNDSNGSESSFSIVAGVADEQKRRRKSFAHTEKEVVTTDQVHPDWEAKVEAMRATVARRANRRIVFRQVGERLIPVGVTSGRAGDGSNPTMSSMQLPPGFAAQVAAAMDSSATGRSSRSSRRRNQEMAEMLAGLGGQDLEELMIEEAMRISMLEDEARQRKEREDRDKAAAAAAQTAGNATPVERSSLDTTRPSDVSAPGPPSTRTMVSEAINAPMGNLSLGSNTTSSTTPTGSLLPASAHAAPPTLSAKPTSSTDTSAPSSLSPSRTSLPPSAPPAVTPSTLQGGSALTPAISTASSVSSISELSSTAGFEPLGDGSEDDTDDRLEEDGQRRQESSSDAGRLIDV